NDGKAQEYKDRKVYNIGRSFLTHTGPNPAPIDEILPDAAPVITLNAADEPAFAGQKIMLFKTPTCPNCKAAGALLDKAGVAYEAINADESRELVEKYGIRQAPTLVLDNGESFEKFRGVSDIKGWLMKRA
ncbi:MAG: glutaredoxin family protein, partial [Clostridia bacterium]|nr:glutaredoxin family protein [Clostridia bacterium]